MNNLPNPYAAPTQDADDASAAARDKGELIRKLTIADAKRVPWKLATYTNVVQLRCASNATQRIYDHRTFVAKTRFVCLLRALFLEGTAPRPVLRLTPEALAALRSWLAPHLHEHLTRALRSARGVAVFLGVFGLCNLVSRHPSVTLASMSVWLLWALGATLVPHRAFLLIAAAIWAWPFLSNVVGMLRGTVSPLYVLAGLAAVAFARSYVRAFRFYGPEEGRRGRRQPKGLGKAARSARRATGRRNRREDRSQVDELEKETRESPEPG